jgi:hypothetical protein
MALQSVTIQPDPERVALSDLPPDLAESHIPRALIKFESVSSITAKTAANIMTLELRLLFPVNFAYVHCNSFLSVASPSEATADDFLDLGYGIQEPIASASPSYGFSLWSRGVATANAGATGPTAGEWKSWYVDGMYGLPLFNRNGSQPRVRMFLNDTDAVNAAAARTLYATSTWFQFDIDQVTNWQVNTPTPVRQC